MEMKTGHISEIQQGRRTSRREMIRTAALRDADRRPVIAGKRALGRVTARAACARRLRKTRIEEDRAAECDP